MRLAAQVVGFALREYARTPVNLLLLVVAPVIFVLVAAEPMANAAELLGGAGAAVETATTGWASAFLAALAMYFLTRQATTADRRLATAGMPTATLVIARLVTGAGLALVGSAAAMTTLLLRGPVEDPLRVAGGAVLFALTYAGIGALVGVFVRDPVNGAVIILLIWIVDVFFGPALTSPDRVALTRWMPTHFITLLMVDQPSQHDGGVGDLGLAIIWPSLATLTAAVFLARSISLRRGRRHLHPGRMSQTLAAINAGARQQRRNPSLGLLLIAVPVIFVALSQAITEERWALMRLVENGLTTDVRVWLPDTHAGTMAPIAVASLAAVAGIFLSTGRSVADRRLVHAGMSRGSHFASRLVELSASLAIAIAATIAVTNFVFSAEQWSWFAVGLLMLGGVYGLLGLCLGYLLDRVSGVLVAFIVPFLDLGITQSPMLRLEPPQFASLLPGYGGYRIILDGGLTDIFDETRGLAVAGGWLVGLAGLAGVLVARSTRLHERSTRSRRAPPTVSRGSRMSKGKTTNWCVLTGGPSSGKTTTVRLLQERGYATTIEHARHYLDLQRLGGHTVEETRSRQREFQRSVVAMQMEQEAALTPGELVFLDRALPDSLAYYRFLGLEPEADLLAAVQRASYRVVFLLDLLPLAADYARTEDPDDQKRIHEVLEEIYIELGYRVVRVPVLSPDARVDWILANI